MSPMQHQLVITYASESHDNDWMNTHHFNFFLDPPNRYVTADHREHYAAGTRAPFLGYTTPTGTIQPTVHFIEKEKEIITLSITGQYYRNG